MKRVAEPSSSALPTDRDQAHARSAASGCRMRTGPRGRPRAATTRVRPVAGRRRPSSELLNLDDPLAAIRGGRPLRRIGSTSRRARELVGRIAATPRAPWLLAPCDLQPVKASGVTFVASLLERVIEEQARGDAAKAEGLRTSILSVIGNSLHDVRPGSAEAMRLKEVLIGAGRLVAVPRGRHRSGRGDLHQVPADGRGRHRRRGRHSPEVGVEQPRAGDRARGQRGRPRRRRVARQRRQPARFRRTQRAAARQGQGQQRLVRDRAVHPPVRRAVSAWTTCGGASWRCTCRGRTGSRSPAAARWPRSAATRWRSSSTPSGRIISIPTA